MKPVFKTNKVSSEKAKQYAELINTTPTFYVTGADVVFVSDDIKEVHSAFRLREDTMSHKGYAFGGALYSSMDAIYPTMLARNLDTTKYIVWDKSASIRYLKPVQQDLYAKYELTDQLIDEIIQEVDQNGSTTKTFVIDYVDLMGNTYVSASKVIYIGLRARFNKR